MAYATYIDVQGRMKRELTSTEITICDNYLDDAAVLIDTFNANVSADAKKLVSCRMVIRALGDGEEDIPIGATQGSMSALGYTQSWTIGSGGNVGELYLSKLDKQTLGYGNKIGSYSPTQELVVEDIPL
jgi:hypothetical protein